MLRDLAGRDRLRRRLEAGAPGARLHPSVDVRAPERLTLGPGAFIDHGVVLHCGGQEWSGGAGRISIGGQHLHRTGVCAVRRRWHRHRRCGADLSGRGHHLPTAQLRRPRHGHPRPAAALRNDHDRARCVDRCERDDPAGRSARPWKRHRRRRRGGAATCRRWPWSSGCRRGWPVSAERPCDLCGSRRQALLYDVDGYPIVRCEDCGLVFVGRAQTAQELTAFYDKRLLGGPRGRRLWRLCGGRGTQAPSLDGLLGALEALRPPGDLLEVGSAYGFFLDEASRRGWRVRGIEPSPHAARHAREQLGLDVASEPLSELATERNSVDAIAMWDVIEHLPDPRATLEAAYAWLRPGGVLGLSTGDVKKPDGPPPRARLEPADAAVAPVLLLSANHEAAPHRHRLRGRPSRWRRQRRRRRNLRSPAGAEGSGACASQAARPSRSLASWARAGSCSFSPAKRPDRGQASEDGANIYRMRTFMTSPWHRRAR